MEEWKRTTMCWLNNRKLCLLFVSASERVWQVTLASCIAGRDIINFTSGYTLTKEHGKSVGFIVCVKRFHFKHLVLSLAVFT